MPYIRATPNPSGAYPAPQSNPAPGLIPLTDEQAQTVVDYNGFVTITETEDRVTVEPDTEARELWRASLPPEEPPMPTQEERLAALEGAMLSMMGVSGGV